MIYRTPEGFYWLSERIIADGSAKDVTAVADTIEAATKQAMRQIPIDSRILKTKELQVPRETTVVVEAIDEYEAMKKVERNYVVAT